MATAFSFIAWRTAFRRSVRLSTPAVVIVDRRSAYLKAAADAAPKGAEAFALYRNDWRRRVHAGEDIQLRLWADRNPQGGVVVQLPRKVQQP